MFELHNHLIVFAKYLQDSQRASKQCSDHCEGSSMQCKARGRANYTFLGDRSAAGRTPGQSALGHVGKLEELGVLLKAICNFIYWVEVCLSKDNVLPRSPFPGSVACSSCHS